MNDRVKFYRMTKPIKFRKFKLFKSDIILWCKALRELTIYNINNLLYKLNILKKYSYRDNVEKVISEFNLYKKEAVSNFIKGTVVMKLVEQKSIDIEYFYKEKKDGSKKITLWVRNKEEVKIFTDSYLNNIYLKVDKRWYNINNQPTFKVVMPKPVEPSFPMESTTKYTELTTVDFDLTCIKNMRLRNLIEFETYNTPLEEVLKFNYDYSVKRFEKTLNIIKLKDLMK